MVDIIFHFFPFIISKRKRENVILRRDPRVFKKNFFNEIVDFITLTNNVVETNISLFTTVVDVFPSIISAEDSDLRDEEVDTV